MTTLTASRRRDRRVVLGGLVGISALAWVYLVVLARDMAGMTSMREWAPSAYLLTLAMWVVMMVAMMVPSITPMTLVYASVARKARTQGNPLPSTAIFVTGYLTIWAAFSVAATTAQFLLERAMLLSPAMTARTPVLGGLLLLAAGAYQLTPIKQTCLQHCRSPVQFLTDRWRTTTPGVLALGARAGISCLGCCWVLMTLLFVGGVMNLLWVAAIAFFVLLEKVLPARLRPTGVAGTVLTLTGAGMLAHAAIG